MSGKRTDHGERADLGNGTAAGDGADVAKMTGSGKRAGAGERTGVRKGAETKRKQLLLRLDPAVHGAIAKWAADDLRSVNAQIEIILRRALVEAGRDPRPKPMRGRGRPRKEPDDEARGPNKKE